MIKGWPTEILYDIAVSYLKEKLMKVSNCCGALFVKPGWPDNDICSACKEHANAGEIDEMTEQEEANNRALSKLDNTIISSEDRMWWEVLNKDNKGKIR